jgi:hypothetical protein
MPDLSHLPSNRLMYVARNWLTGQGYLAERVPRSMVLLFVRLTDKAVAEYAVARDCLIAFATRPNNDDNAYLLRYFEGIDHLETCLNAADRASEAARWLRKHLPDLFIAPGEHLSQAERRRLSDVRNRSEHVDRDLTNERIAEGGSIVLEPFVDAVEFGDNVIPYVELADWLSRLHVLAARLTDLPRSRDD